MCWYTGRLNRLGVLECGLEDPSKQSAVYCPNGQQNCDRYTQMQSIFNRGTEQQGWNTAYVQEKPNSLVFNVFIFLQVSYVLWSTLIYLCSTCCMPRHACLVVQGD